MIYGPSIALLLLVLALYKVLQTLLTAIIMLTQLSQHPPTIS